MTGLTIAYPSRDADEISLMVMDESSLGFVFNKGSSLYLWSRKVNSEAPAEWVQCRVMELETIMPFLDPRIAPSVVGSAEGAIFISTVVGLFTVELKSGRVRKVGEFGDYVSVLPYMSFCTPGIVLAPACLLSCIFLYACLIRWFCQLVMM